MKADISIEVAVPQGVAAMLDEKTLSIKGPKGEVRKTFAIPGLEIIIMDSKIVLNYKQATQRGKAKVNTVRAHIRNMINGSINGHDYEMKICSGHFPMKVLVEGDKFIVKNFLGEAKPRVTKILKDTKITVDGELIKITSINKESAGQMAANIEKLTVVRGRDVRIFQDGIYIISKSGKRLL